jgi:NAD(P)-dependent dehydrogenase (short-subunit alcohol dehydrogenase family)
VNTSTASTPHAEAASSGLEGRVAIVTGAGSRSAEIGNGRAAALLLARRGGGGFFLCG